MVKKTKKQEIEEAEAEVRQVQLKAKLLKIKIAVTGMGRNFPTTPEARRELIQKTQPKGLAKGKNQKKTEQSRIQQQGEFINYKYPIYPEGADAKINPDLKKRLAKIKVALDEKTFRKRERVREKQNPLPTERQPKGFGESLGLTQAPALIKQVPFGKDKRSGFRRNLLDITNDDTLQSFKTDGNKITPPEGLNMKSPFKPRRDNLTGLPSRKAPRQSDRTRIIQAKTAHDHGHTILMKGHTRGVYRSASLESQRGKYAKYWLLNAKETNGNGWGIAAHSAKANMSKFIGRPLVITSAKWRGSKVKDRYGDTFDHPYVPTNDLNTIFEHQEQYRVGSIVDVQMDKNNDYFATVEMLPKYANMALPPFCSPAIYQLDAREAEGQISKWEALHLAALDENPAYGARIALLRGTCVGTNDECKVQFKSAKLKQVSIVCTKGVKSKIANIFDEAEMNEDVGSAAYLKKRKPNHMINKMRKDLMKEKVSKLKKKLKLASQGLENMTYQNSKKIKIHSKKHPEVRKAKKSVDDILRGVGSSIDGSQHDSTFLSQRGDFIGGGNAHNVQAEQSSGLGLSDFQKKHGLVKVQRFPINRAGEKRMSVGINNKINKTQLKSIQDLEIGGHDIGFAVGPDDATAITGRGSRDMIKALRKHKLL